MSRYISSIELAEKICPYEQCGGYDHCDACRVRSQEIIDQREEEKTWMPAHIAEYHKHPEDEI